MTAPRIDEVAEPRLGQTYFVLHATVPSADIAAVIGTSSVPLLGPAHVDLDVDPNIPLHWHIDWRFAPSSLWEIATESIGVRVAGGLCLVPDKENAYPARCYRLVVQTGHLETRWRDAVFMRTPPPYKAAQAKHLAKLEAACEAHGLQALPGCRTCPHRGLPLGSIPPEPDGTVTCPGHGLRWNLATGKLVRQTPP